MTATHAAESDIKQLPNLLHGEESVLYGDQAYWKEADRQAFEDGRPLRRAASGRPPLDSGRADLGGHPKPAIGGHLKSGHWG